MRLLSKSASLLSNYAVKVTSFQLRNFAKALSKEPMALNQETLTGRLLLYLNIDKEQSTNPIIPATKTFKNIRQNINHMYKLNTPEIIEITSSLTTQNIPGSELDFILKELDVEYTLRLPELSVRDILQLLNVYMCVAQNQISEYKFYNKALNALNDSLTTLDKKQLLQFIFYLGVKKKCLESQTMLRQCQKTMTNEFIDSLTSEELCIICISTFKTSTKIINKTLLNKVKKYIDGNLSVLEDFPLFVTLVKTLRHNRCQDDNLLNTISYAVIFNKTYSYTFSTICHILALYADYFYYDKNLFKIFIQQCLEQLTDCDFVSKNIYVTHQLRAKDIKRLLWVLSMFSDLKLVNRNILKTLFIPKIIERIEGQEINKDVSSLVDIMLYLWMLNCHPHELVPYVFTKENAQLLHKDYKNNLRLNLLLYAILIEDPELSKKLPIKAPTERKHDYTSFFQLRKRPLFERLLRNLDKIKKDLNISKFELSYAVPHMNIVGITGYRSGGTKAVHIEVLDQYTQIRNLEYDVPVGLMAMKLRLLDQFEEGVLVVSQRETDDMTDAELINFLLDEIKLIC
ncbi:uncharacterized protein LOC123010424 [Tribolium madens]|uniref:uncharacterized protein LOC123010424 n=1 Tax=Tribolium madens TaxID=41895 RepID=UPI001CF74462|nr:uncharacterized protein LOC123010424 [Tribolium madens]